MVIIRSFRNKRIKGDQESSLSHPHDIYWSLYGRAGFILTGWKHAFGKTIRVEKERCQTQFQVEFSPRRDALISRIVQLKLTEDEHSKDLQDLRRQLAEISRQATEEEQSYLQLTNVSLRQSRQHWNEILHWIHEQEQGSYSINDDDAQLMDILDL